MKKGTWSYLLVLLAAMISSCGDQPAKKEETKSPAAKPYELKEYSVKVRSGVVVNGQDTTSVSLSWVAFQPEETGVLATINKSIKASLQEVIASVIVGGEEDTLKMPDDMVPTAQMFIQHYEKAVKEYDEEISWFLDAEIDTVYTSPSVISLSMWVSTFTGGAHGYEGNYSFHFDPQTGKEINPLDFFADTLKLGQALEKQFRKDAQLSDKQPLSDGGLYPEQLEFPMPAEMYFDHDGFYAIYNAYEIAPYSEGQIIVHLPDNDFRALLKDAKKP